MLGAFFSTVWISAVLDADKSWIWCYYHCSYCPSCLRWQEAESSLNLFQNNLLKHFVQNLNKSSSKPWASAGCTVTSLSRVSSMLWPVDCSGFRRIPQMLNWILFWGIRRPVWHLEFLVRFLKNIPGQFLWCCRHVVLLEGHCHPAGLLTWGAVVDP